MEKISSIRSKARTLVEQVTLIDRVVNNCEFYHEPEQYPPEFVSDLPDNFQGTTYDYLQLIQNNRKHGIHPSLVYAAFAGPEYLEDEISDSLDGFANSGDPLCIAVIGFLGSTPRAQREIDVTCRFVKKMVARTMTREEYHQFLGLKKPFTHSFPGGKPLYLAIPMGIEDYHTESETLYPTPDQLSFDRRP